MAGFTRRPKRKLVATGVVILALGAGIATAVAATWHSSVTFPAQAVTVTQPPMTTRPHLPYGVDTVVRPAEAFIGTFPAQTIVTTVSGPAITTTTDPSTTTVTTAPVTTTDPTTTDTEPTTTGSSPPATTTTTTTGTGSGDYPLHTDIVATTFWVGEVFDSNASDGSQVCSAYDSEWAYHWSGIDNGANESSTTCRGAPLGGCDGVPSGSGSSFTCDTEKRTPANDYFPTNVPTPRENPFYVDLPFDDVNDPVAFAERCTVIPWASEYPSSDCTNPDFSYMKNHWVEITGPNGATCYGQVEDAGPSAGSNYHDANYVFGTNDARPANQAYSGDPTQGDGMDVSPALNGCLGFADLDGDDDHVSWQFVDAPPTGPWTDIVTTSPVFDG
jgi:hypothetical protein